MPTSTKHVPRLRAGVAAGVALALGGIACGGRSEPVMYGAAASVLQVKVPGGVTAAMIAGVRAVGGVSAATAVSMVPVDAWAGSRTSRLTLAAVDPVEFDALSPAVLGATDVASRLHAGTLLLSAAHVQRLDVAEGETVRVRSKRGPVATVPVSPVDAVSSLADGITAARSPWVGAPAPTMLLVGVVPGLDTDGVARALADRLQGDLTVAAPRPFIGGRVASRLFGSFSYVVHPDGRITEDPRWVRANIAGSRVPVLGWVRCHRLMLPQLAMALREIQQRRLTGLIDRRGYGGCYVARTILWDPKNPLSMHAWGLAIDINVPQNPYGRTPRLDPRIVTVFKRWGFRWGGDWKIPDGMHFELAALMRR